MSSRLQLWTVRLVSKKIFLLEKKIRIKSGLIGVGEKQKRVEVVKQSECVIYMYGTVKKKNKLIKLIKKYQN